MSHYADRALAMHMCFMRLGLPTTPSYLGMALFRRSTIVADKRQVSKFEAFVRAHAPELREAAVELFVSRLEAGE